MPSYALQSLLAAITVVIILVFLDILAEAAIVAALGASTFIVFAMPKSGTAQPRKVLGRHAVGVISGSLCYLVVLWARTYTLAFAAMLSLAKYLLRPWLKA